METFDSAYGTVNVLTSDAIMAEMAARIEQADGTMLQTTIGLSGGSTPKEFYRWVVENKPFSEKTLSTTVWATSDERMVPLESEESNFGVADRMMLEPLGIKGRGRLPWPVMVDPHSAARVFNMRWSERFGHGRVFDLCLLGMGDDGHTASLFPGSPLIGTPIPDPFACVEVRGKGWRLTITPEGLGLCHEILITVIGEKKAGVLKEVFEGEPGRFPVQILGNWKSRVTWLVDEAAASKLS